MLSSVDYYSQLQKKVDSGEYQHLLDARRVGINYIHEMGQYPKADDIIMKENVTIADFEIPIPSNYIGYVSNFKTDTQSFHLDQIEWLTIEDDVDRLKEIGIDTNTLPNGFYIHNPKSYPMYCQVNDKTKFSIIVSPAAKQKNVSMSEFVEHLNNQGDYQIPFHVIIEEGYVKSIIEQYVP